MTYPPLRGVRTLDELILMIGHRMGRATAADAGLRPRVAQPGGSQEFLATFCGCRGAEKPCTAIANLASDHLADVADAAERGIHRVCSSEQLVWSFITHALAISHQPPQD